MGRTACTEPQCLYRGALFTVIGRTSGRRLGTFKKVLFRAEFTYTYYSRLQEDCGMRLSGLRM